MKVSVLVPARNEPYLQQTVSDLLSKASGDVEVIAILDGYWPDPPLQSDTRLKILHRGQAHGLRAAVNAAAQMATGTHLLKCDAHTLWAEGYDRTLLEDYAEDNWILIPKRWPLDPEKWAIQERNDRKYPIDYHYLSSDLHGTPWAERRAARSHIDVDAELASQGSAWFVSRKCWDWLGPLDVANYGPFWLENLEMSLTCWLRGGAQMVTKRTWYAHWHKPSRGYTTPSGQEAAAAYARWFWLTDQELPGRVYRMRSLIEKFSPVPTWGDIDGIFERAKQVPACA